MCCDCKECIKWRNMSIGLQAENSRLETQCNLAEETLIAHLEEMNRLQRENMLLKNKLKGD